MQTKRWLVVIALIMTCAVTVDTCPAPPPQPLRSLTLESDLIVVAKVGNVLSKENERQSGNFIFQQRRGDALVQLHISQVVKGDFSNRIVNVHYWRALLGEMPPDSTVLAFLYEEDENNHCYLVSLEWGFKSLAPKAVEIYVARIKELLEIENQTDPATHQQLLVEWLVRCAEDPVTRWEGAYDLLFGYSLKRWQQENAEREKEEQIGQAEETNNATTIEETTAEEALTEAEAEEESSETKGAEEIIDYVALLSEEQKQRLLKALYSSPLLSDEELMLIELAEEWKDENLIPFLWSYLKAFKQNTPLLTQELMSRIADSFGNQAATTLVERFSELDYESIKEGQQKGLQEHHKLLDEFIRLIENLGPPRLVEIKTEQR
jgi:hypothetical protein